MKDRIGVALAGAGIAALALACARPQPAAPPQPAPAVVARVDAVPGSADVVLDGKAMGETPLVLRVVAFDDLLRVTALSGGREPVEKRVRVISEKEAEILRPFADVLPSHVAQPAGCAQCRNYVPGILLSSRNIP